MAIYFIVFGVRFALVYETVMTQTSTILSYVLLFATLTSASHFALDSSLVLRQHYGLMALSLSRHKNFVQFRIIGCIRSPLHFQAIR